jgi:hypothetical protein
MPMIEFKVKDQKLAPQGALLVEWAKKRKPKSEADSKKKNL